MSLLDLPNELLLLVAEYLETEEHVPKDLCSLLCVNRRLACLLCPLFRKELLGYYVAIFPEEPFRYEEKIGLLPIKWAILKNDLGLLRLLLKHGVDVNELEEEYIISSTRVHILTLINHSHKMPALQLAVGFGRKRMTKLLLQNGVSNYTDGRGLTAVHTAVFFRQNRILKMLLRFGMDINARSRIGITPLHLAVMHGYKRCVKILIDRGADLTVLDQNGFTPLNRASNPLPITADRPWNRREIIKLLLDAGGEVYDLETLDEVVAWKTKQPDSPYSYMGGTWETMCDISRGKAAPTVTEWGYSA